MKIPTSITPTTIAADVVAVAIVGAVAVWLTTGAIDADRAVNILLVVIAYVFGRARSPSDTGGTPVP